MASSESTRIQNPATGRTTYYTPRPDRRSFRARSTRPIDCPQWFYKMTSIIVMLLAIYLCYVTIVEYILNKIK